MQVSFSADNDFDSNAQWDLLLANLHAFFFSPQHRMRNWEETDQFTEQR